MLNKRNGEYYGMWCKNGGAGKTDNTSAVYETNNHWGYVWDNQATYDKRFGKHSLNVNLVQSIQYQQWESSYQKQETYLIIVSGITWTQLHQPIFKHHKQTISRLVLPHFRSYSIFIYG